MAKKKRKTVAPNFVLWTKESQQRLDRAIAHQSDLLSRLEQLEAKTSAGRERGQVIANLINEAVADLRDVAEKLAVRSKGAARANATRRFDEAWQRASLAGYADEALGAEYDRVKGLWQTAGQPLPADDFIKFSCNGQASAEPEQSHIGDLAEQQQGG